MWSKLFIYTLFLIVTYLFVDATLLRCGLSSSLNQQNQSHNWLSALLTSQQERLNELWKNHTPKLALPNPSVKNDDTFLIAVPDTNIAEVKKNEELSEHVESSGSIANSPETFVSSDATVNSASSEAAEPKEEQVNEEINSDVVKEELTIPKSTPKRKITRKSIS